MSHISPQYHQRLIAILARPEGEKVLLLFMGRRSLYRALQLHKNGTPVYHLSDRVHRQIHQAIITLM